MLRRSSRLAHRITALQDNIIVAHKSQKETPFSFSHILELRFYLLANPQVLTLPSFSSATANKMHFSFFQHLIHTGCKLFNYLCRNEYMRYTYKCMIENNQGIFTFVAKIDTASH